MNIENFIPVHTVCTSYQVEISFINELREIGLIEINMVEEIGYIHHDHVGSVEKMIRMHQDLEINIEGIDVVFNLLNKIEDLQQELKGTRNKLRMYEG